MKKVILATIVLLYSIQMEAQNRQTEVKTKTTTVKDSEGVHKTVKTEVIKKEQKIVLGEEKPNTKNIPVVDSPVEVTKTTKITNPDGTTRVLNIKIDLKKLKEANRADGEKYIGLKDQLAIESQKLEGYGNYLVSLFA